MIACEILAGGTPNFSSAKRARTAVKSVRPDAIVSAVVGSDPLTALSDYLQDWPTWVENRFIDAVTVDSADTSRGAALSPAALPQR